MRLGGGGVITSLIQANDPWISLDGRLNAPAGSPQYPSLFNTYVPSGTAQGRYYLGQGGGRQPPWHVAGVDYAVGLSNPNATFLDPTVNTLPNGATYNAAGRYIRVNNDNTTFTNWDFSAPGLDGQGVSLYTGGANNTVVQNCKFYRGPNLIAANNQFVIQCPSGSITVQYCYINDGGLASVGTSTVVSPPFFGSQGTNSSSSSSFQIYYCWVQYIICGHPWEISIPVTDKYNLYDGMGYAPWAHGNGGLFVGTNTLGTPAVIPNSVMQFRCLIGGPASQTGGYPTGMCESYQCYSDNFMTLTGTNIGYNSAINPTYSTQCYIVHVSGSANSLGPNTNDSTTVHNNYVDPGDALGYDYFASPDPSTNINNYSNVDMTNGNTIPRSPTTFTNTSFTFSHTLISNGYAVGQVSADQSPTTWLIMGPLAWSDGSWGSNVITSASYSSGSITWNTTSAHGVSVGQRFVIEGSEPDGYNGQFTAITGTTGTTLVASSSAVGVETVAGTLEPGGGGYLTSPGTFFAIDNSGNITINAHGANNLAAGTYQFLVGAGNSGSHNSATVTVTIT